MSVILALNDAEEALTELANAIRDHVHNEDTRKEYFTLLQQACVSLNRIRATQETVDWLKDFDWSKLDRRGSG